MVDVTVFGAGAFGLSVAWCCARRGAAVRVIDPDGVGAGASGGIVGALAPHVPEQWNEKKAFQLESLLMGADFWGEVEAVGGLSPGYARTGRWQPLADAGALALARTRAESAARLWQGRAAWDVIERPDDDWAPATPTGYLIHDTLTGRLHPRQACDALAAALRAKGGEIATGGRAEGQVVWATGWRGLEDMTARHTRLVGTGIKGQALLLGHDAATMPQLFVEGLHIVPHAGGTVAIGSTTERDFAAADTTDSQCDVLLARARTAVPALAEAREIRRWAGVRPRSRTRAPMLGRHPFREGDFLANGGFKIGFGMAPLAGEVMADLVLEGQDRIPAGFDPRASL
ncbi:MAG: FAD-dependent oxidoreductase [Salibaculum sp.]|jgi:glycine/D-amino acid oxidase-like deaminating enzyme|uniref:NAD(P)/FAD-dependent oxidoreductase n=1 Tax=Roseovarius halophilus (ex Wu et al. 2025) TaxID=3376060 RepID=UPI0028701200|nr:FAD-dependent oxidoreductase [Salibaculum sp.]MDR9426858.1 FAD-dependent oxidoreductase [Salibaculum sp.]MDR9481411.1 FAD-dependent oxidoreductase [Salibaculum sp.]